MREITMGEGSKIAFAGVQIENRGDAPVTVEVEDGVITSRGPVTITWTDPEARKAFEEVMWPGANL